MKGFLGEVIRDKILMALENPPPELTRRDQIVPKVAGKAFVVIR